MFVGFFLLVFSLIVFLFVCFCYVFLNYSLLNFRTEEDKSILHMNELSWLESLLQTHPKSYWVWYHRQWLTPRMFLVSQCYSI
jgi:hypothetical protein